MAVANVDGVPEPPTTLVPKYVVPAITLLDPSEVKYTVPHTLVIKLFQSGSASLPVLDLLNCIFIRPPAPQKLVVAVALGNVIVSVNVIVQAVLVCPVCAV